MGLSLVVVLGLLKAVASIFVEHGLQGVWTSEHRLNGSGAQLSCSTPCDIFSDQGPIHVSHIGKQILYHGGTM